MLKRVFLVGLLVFVMVLTAACGNTNNNTSPDPNNEPPEEDPYPVEPVKIVVGYGAGGSTDQVIRLIQPYLSEQLGTPIVIENMTGSSGMIAANFVHNAEPDGYTLFCFPNPTSVLVEKFQGNAPPFQEFEYIGNIAGKESTGIAVAPDSDIKTYDDLIEAAKSRDLLYSVTQGLSNSTLGYVLLADAEGIEFTKIPYESGSKSVSAVIGGHADVTITSTMTLTPMMENGELNVLAYFAEEPLPGFEDVPLFSEMHPGAAYSAFIGLLAPPGTPEYIVNALREALKNAANDPEYIAATEGKYSLDYMDGEAFRQRTIDLYETSEALRPAIEAALID